MKIKLNITLTPEIYNILEVLEKNNGSVRLVGGIVRDSIIGIENSDIDIATRLLPTKTMEILRKNNIHYVDTGSKYGTITAITKNGNIEITTLRIDTDCNGRHTNAIFTDDFEQDALRRDFTINAMSYSPFDDELYDYCGGYKDLLDKKVRFIGDPEKRIAEDYLRILRFFRFSDRFAQYLDNPSFEACKKMCGFISHLSKERILMEMSKLLLSPTAYSILQVMIDSGIMKEINAKITWDVALLKEIKSSQLPLIWACLIHRTSPKILEDQLHKMHFKNSDIKRIVNLVKLKQAHPDISCYSTTELQNIFYPLWVDGETMDCYIAITQAVKYNNFDPLNIIISKAPPKFPISGDEIVKKGFTGKDIGYTLDKLKLIWIQSDFNISKEKLLEKI